MVSRSHEIFNVLYLQMTILLSIIICINFISKCGRLQWGCSRTSRPNSGFSPLQNYGRIVECLFSLGPNHYTFYGGSSAVREISGPAKKGQQHSIRPSTTTVGSIKRKYTWGVSSYPGVLESEGDFLMLTRK